MESVPCWPRLAGCQGRMGTWGAGQRFRETVRWSSLSWDKADRVERLQTLLIQVFGSNWEMQGIANICHEILCTELVVTASLASAHFMSVGPFLLGRSRGRRGGRPRGEDEEQKGRCVQCCCKPQATHPTGSTWREVVALTSSQESSLSQSH